ncbi:hypothetical protein [Puia dinghuensis]|uniref:DoxX family protein n=1 Tax=Puia dinghuensis TaxID=1792502 RepID=A0A8J2UDT6_9BACT|nr:hypothetical protein [Puia dinghuensis]GGB03759.1 hypothetical protein GCM10011511_28840 [Puia dinghuensis]
MKKLTGMGPLLYAVALIGFGITQLMTRDFLTGLFPVPATLPLRTLWLIVSSILFLIAAVGMLFLGRKWLAAALAGSLFFVFFLFLHLPKLLGDMYNPLEWSPLFEGLMLGSGGFIIAAYLIDSGMGDPGWNKPLHVMALMGQYLFAVSLVVFAVLHIKYNDYIQTLMPAWLPGHVFWSYVVIAAFLLSAISFFTGLKLPLASGLLGIMFMLWVLIMHAPRAFGKPTAETEWSSLFTALAVCGTAFTVCRQTAVWHRRGVQREAAVEGVAG